MILVATLAISALSGTAYAATPPSTQSDAAVYAIQPRDVVDIDDIDRVADRLGRVPYDAPPEAAARILFPRDPAAQRDYLETVGNPQFPPFIIPVLTRCVLGAIGNVALQELVVAVSARDNFKVETVVDSVITGCIAAVLPKGLQAAAEAAKRPLVSTIAAVIIYLSGKFKR